MVNISLRNGMKFSVSFFQADRHFGPKGIRRVMECDVFCVVKGEMVFYNRGIAILNPLDTFDEWLGAKKALASAIIDLPREDRKDIQAIVARW